LLKKKLIEHSNGYFKILRDIFINFEVILFIMDSNLQIRQINVKLPNKLLSEAQLYADNLGYTNIQELIRDTLRERVFEEKLNSDFVNDMLNNSDYKKTMGVKASKKLFEEMKNRSNEV
jgi:hypothetical protein